MAEEEKKEVKQPTETWGIGKITTETEPRVVNVKTQQAYTVEEALVILLNDVDKLKKLLD